MGKRITLEFPALPIWGRIISRSTRFTLLVELTGGVEEVYLPNPGALSTVVVSGREICCIPNSKEGRRTRFDGLAVRIGEMYATVDSRLANTVFQKAVDNGLIFSECRLFAREKSLTGYGRIDFILEDSDGGLVYVEVKSCTHVERGVAMFPDRPTERGRRHLESLRRLVEAGEKCWVVFIVQRPDADRLRPFSEVDEQFSHLLSRAVRSGLKTLAIATSFTPPETVELRGEIPIDL